MATNYLTLRKTSGGVSTVYWTSATAWFGTDTTGAAGFGVGTSFYTLHVDASDVITWDTTGLATGSFLSIDSATDIMSWIASASVAKTVWS